MRKTMIAVLASSMAFAAVPAVAQTNNGLVVVDLSGADVSVLNNLARDLNISDIEILKNVQVSVPIGLAAAICGIDANVLASQRKNADYKCTAENSTTALTKAVREKMN